MASNDPKPLAPRPLTAAEFARLSTSLQLTLAIIRKAQLASRKVIAATPDWKRRYGSP
ncbi:MAG TPA: hypothetical protein VF814_18520 [Casimicrobiaceae bacterium]